MLRNTNATYGSVAKWLHWIMVLWVAGAYAIIEYGLSLHTGEGPIPLLNNHRAVGLSSLIPLSIRIYWRLTNPVPSHPETMTKWQVRASRLSHFLLYFFLVSMPITGYLGSGGGINYGIFQVPAFRNTAVGSWIMETFELTRQQFEAPFDFYHYHLVGPTILWPLILLHAGAALYHHFVQKDDVLRRMLPGRKSSKQSSGRRLGEEPV